MTDRARIAEGRTAEVRPSSRGTAAAWRRPVGAARIVEGIPDEIAVLLPIVEGREA